MGKKETTTRNALFLEVRSNKCCYFLAVLTNNKITQKLLVSDVAVSKNVGKLFLNVLHYVYY
jgi:hypothetical protein